MSATSPRPEPPGARRAIINVATHWGSFLLSAIVGFFLSPFIVHSLGNEAYGAWALIGSLVGYLGMLDLGVRGAVMRHVANQHAAGRHDEAGRIISAALMMFGLSGLAAVAITSAFATWGLHLFELPVGLRDVAGPVVIIGGVNLAVSLLAGVFGGPVAGVHRFDVLHGINLAVTLARAAAVVAVLRAGGGLISLALVQLVASVATGVALAVAAHRVYPELRFGLRGWNRGHLRTLVSFGAFASLLQVANLVMTHTDTVIIGAMLPVTAVTFFSIAVGLIGYARQFISGISQTMTPMVGALQGADHTERVTGALLTGARLATLVMLPILVTFVVRGVTFIGLWMGPEYAAPSGAVLTILAIARGPGSGYQVCVSTLMGLNRHRGLVPITLLEATANVALSLALVGPLGISGVALGTLIPRLFVTGIFGPRFVQKTIGLAPTRYYREVWGRPALAMIPFTVATVFLERLAAPPHLAAFFAEVALVLPVAAAGAWLVALRPEEKTRIGVALRTALARTR